MTDTEPIACSLDGGELEARLRAVQDAGRDALLSHERPGHERPGRGYLLRFRRERETRERLEEIIQAERQCCPFLSLTLEETDDKILLSIEAPPGGEPTAAGLAAAFAGASA